VIREGDVHSEVRQVSRYSAYGYTPDRSMTQRVYAFPVKVKSDRINFLSFVGANPSGHMAFNPGVQHAIQTLKFYNVFNPKSLD
jgi:hypothetical protein